MKNKMLAAAGIILLIILVLLAYFWFNASHLTDSSVSVNPPAQSGQQTSSPSCVLSTNKKTYKPGDPTDLVIASWTTQNATSVSFKQDLQSAGTEIFPVPQGQQSLSGTTKLPMGHVGGYEVIQLDVTGPGGSSTCTTDFYMSVGTASIPSAQIVTIGTLPTTFVLGLTSQINKMAAESIDYNLTLTLETSSYDAADNTKGTVVLVKDHNTEFPVYILNNQSTELNLISGHLKLGAAINKDSSVTFTLSN